MKRINIEVPDEICAWKERQGIKWKPLLALGVEAIELRFKNNELDEQLRKLQRVNAHLQAELLKLRDELDTKKAEAGP